MIGLAIVAVLGLPIAFLTIGFLGVSQKRADEGRAHIASSSPLSEQTEAQPVRKEAQLV